MKRVITLIVAAEVVEEEFPWSETWEEAIRERISFVLQDDFGRSEIPEVGRLDGFAGPFLAGISVSSETIP